MARLVATRVERSVVAAWFDLQPAAAQPLLRAAHQLVLDTAPGLVAVVKWGHLVYSLQGRHLLALVPHRHHANLQVFHGAALQLPGVELGGQGREMRHLKLPLGQMPDAERVPRVVQAALALHAAAGADA